MMGIKSGYQPTKTDKRKKIIPPNTGSNVKQRSIVIHLKKDAIKDAYYKLLSEYAKLQKSKESMERQFKYELNKSIHNEVLLCQQIEKMKNCANCKHRKFYGNEAECKIGYCNNNEKWELAED